MIVPELGRPRRAEESFLANKPVSFSGVLLRIAVLDINLLLDPVITAARGAKGDSKGPVVVMIIAVVSAVIVELIFAGRVGDLVGRHPMLEMEALSFLMRIGMTLVAARIGLHFGKRPVCFAKAHWLVVEILNMRVRAKSMKRASVSPEG